MIASLALYLAMYAIELARSSGLSSPAWHALIAAIPWAAAIGVRFGWHRLVAWRPPLGDWRRPAAWIGSIAGVVALVSLKSMGSIGLSGEETLLTALVIVAAVLHAVEAAAVRSASWVNLLCMATIAFALPGMPAEFRTPATVLFVSAGALILCGTAQSLRDRTSIGHAIAAIALVVVAATVSAAIIKPRGIDLGGYAAWVPTSGGDGAGDDNARRGVGDGPDESRDGDAPSLGFDAGDKFAESGRDGLYDLWMEAYGEPVIREDGQQKMVGLKPKDLQLAPGTDRENLKVGRSFQLRRQPTAATQPARTGDVAASAAAWVKGPVPVYIPLATFLDYADGTWTELGHGTTYVPVRWIASERWMEMIHRPVSPAFAGEATYEVRIGTLGGAVLPLPSLTNRLRMGRVDRPQFFAGTATAQVRLAGRNLPAGTTIESKNKVVDPARLVNVEPELERFADARTHEHGALSGRAAELAHEWADGRERGWKQIEQVVLRLRDHVSHDRDAVADAMSPIDDLLFGPRRAGRDHTIATTAALMLRSLGYSTRLVGGLYADQPTVDARSGFAPLDASAAHFWIEVRLADGTWVTVDPTPGYPLLQLPVSPAERLAQAFAVASGFVVRHTGKLTLVAAVAGVLFALRRRLIDAACTAYVAARGFAPLAVLRLIERRARLCGAARPASEPVGRWLATRLDAPIAREFADLANRELFAPSAESALSADERRVARDALSNFTRDLLQRHRSKTP